MIAATHRRDRARRRLRSRRRSRTRSSPGSVPHWRAGFCHRGSSAVNQDPSTNASWTRTTFCTSVMDDLCVCEPPVEGRSWGVDFDVGDVERDRGLTLVSRPVCAAPIDATAGREYEPVKGLRLELILRDENVAIDFRGVIHPPLHEVGVVVEDLLRVVRGDRSRERDVQTPPGLAVLVPGFDLARLDARIRKQERRGQIVPAGVADEIADLQRVPRRRDFVSGERGAWVVAPLDRDLVVGVDDDPLRIDIEDRASLDAVERPHEDVLATRVELHRGLIAEYLGPPLSAPEWAADREARGDAMDTRPAVDSPVSVQDPGQEIVHGESPSA